jgi:hypothetical protein
VHDLEVFNRIPCQLDSWRRLGYVSGFPVEDDYRVSLLALKGIVEALENAWPVPVINDFELIEDPPLIYAPRSGPESPVEKPTDPAIHIKFEVKSEGYEDQTLSLCYLLSTIEPALGDLK